MSYYQEMSRLGAIKLANGERIVLSQGGYAMPYRVALMHGDRELSVRYAETLVEVSAIVDLIKDASRVP